MFFGNNQCLACGTPLGYEPERGLVCPLEPAGLAGVWRNVGATAADSALYRRCANFELAAGCDWLVPVDVAATQPLCRACRLNRTIPDLGDASNRLWWALIEQAKRRLVSSLIALGLPLRSRISEDRVAGLAFDFLRAPPGGPSISTGHADGIITLDVEEADDASRERTRIQFDEPYRTVLGHLRHEVGHYYWQRLVDGSAWHEPFRALFGDERADYRSAIERHHRDGPEPQWTLRHVSAYASAHPWEDWAETWAHYLHMVDTLDTALSYGVDAERAELQYKPLSAVMPIPDQTAAAPAFLAFLSRWIGLTGVLNELSRSMGLPDFYPFVLSATAVAKLHFIDRVVAPPRSIGGGIAGGSRTGTGLSAG